MQRGRGVFFGVSSPQQQHICCSSLVVARAMTVETCIRVQSHFQHVFHVVQAGAGAEPGLQAAEGANNGKVKTSSAVWHRLWSDKTEVVCSCRVVSRSSHMAAQHSPCRAAAAAAALSPACCAAGLLLCPSWAHKPLVIDHHHHKQHGLLLPSSSSSCWCLLLTPSTCLSPAGGGGQEFPQPAMMAGGMYDGMYDGNMGPNMGPGWGPNPAMAGVLTRGVWQHNTCMQQLQDVPANTCCTLL